MGALERPGRCAARVGICALTFLMLAMWSVGLATTTPAGAQTEPQVDIAAGTPPRYLLLAPPDDPDWCTRPDPYDAVEVELFDGQFVLTRSDATGDLTVTYAVTLPGEAPPPTVAVPGEDYEPLPGSVTFADGESEVIIPVRILAFEPGGGEPFGLVEVTVTDGSGYIVGEATASFFVTAADGSVACGENLPLPAPPEPDPDGQVGGEVLARTGPSGVTTALLVGAGLGLVAVGWAVWRAGTRRSVAGADVAA